MIRTSIVALVLLVGSVGAAAGQNRGGRFELDEGPIATLLEAAAELALSPAQIERLEQIDAEMDQQNQPLVARLIGIRTRIRALGSRRNFTPEQRAQYEILLDEARPLMRQIRRSNRAAMEEVGNLLSETQKARMAEILEESQDDSRERRRGSTRSDGR